MLNAYPLFIAFAGILASVLLSGRALALMQADAKAALLDSASSTRLLTVVVLGVFFALLLWRPLWAWIFLGCAYLGLGARSVLRLRRLNLPGPAARLLLIGNLAAVVGVSLCAFILAVKALS